MLAPSDTLSFLQNLVNNGFTDEHIRIVHFKENETIATHRSYAESTGAFRNGGRNMVVCQRLQYISNTINTSSGSITKLALEAEKQFPMPHSK